MVSNKEKPKFKLSFFREISGTIRAISSLIFLILGLTLTHEVLFGNGPIIGFNTVLELVIASVVAGFGYFIFPDLCIAVKNWIEDIVYSAVQAIVSDFWEQQSKKITEVRREKQLKKSQEEAEKKVKDLQNGVVLDTSVLIDGRILDIAKTGFLDKNYIVPQCVLAELHTLSDSKDSIKRQRGRRGLDVANKLKKYGQVTTIDDVSKVVGDVDKKVTMLAKDKGIPLMTLDFNLNKVASISGVKVLNINELVDAIKTVLLPGENVIVEIVNQGKTNSQGIGYLGDGTMIVVDGARDKVGQEVAAKVKKVIQSKAGRMIFCEISQ